MPTHRSFDSSLLPVPTEFHDAVAALRARATPAPGARRALTRDAALALIESVRAMIAKPDERMAIEHRVMLIASITHNSCVAYTEVDQLALGFATHIGSDQHVMISTDVRDADALKTVIEHALSRATPPRPPSIDEAPDPSLPPPPPSTYLPVTLWHTGTEQAMGHFSSDIVARMIAAMKGAGGPAGAGEMLSGAGTVVLMQRVRMLSFKSLDAVWGEDTDCEVTVSSRTQDGKASGWSGQAHRDWTRLDPEQVTRQAIDMAQRSRGAVRVEPGRYTAILGHAAVGALLAQMRPAFNVESAGPFSIPLPPMDDEAYRMAKKTRLGDRVFDPRISLWTDPSDPEGGDYPFTEYGGSPIAKARWVDQGVLRMLAYPSGEGIRFPWPPMPPPNIITMSGGTTTIDEMIAQCERGIYVNRLSEVERVDQFSGTMQGTTRDGCFFIKDGKIHSAAANFRFYESPFLKFNNVVALGPSRRVAFGFPPIQVGRGYSASTIANMWPTAPIVAPSMMVRDFNFSSLSDAV